VNSYTNLPLNNSVFKNMLECYYHINGKLIKPKNNKPIKKVTMSNEDSVKNFYVILERAMSTSEAARREGLLALEESIDKDKAANRDIFDYGMLFVVDGVDYSFIDKILSNIIKQEKDENELLLKTIQKEAVLTIQKGENPRILISILNSYTNIPLNDPVFKKKLEDD